MAADLEGADLEKVVRKKKKGGGLGSLGLHWGLDQCLIQVKVLKHLTTTPLTQRNLFASHFCLSPYQDVACKTAINNSLRQWGERYSGHSIKCIDWTSGGRIWAGPDPVSVCALLSIGSTPFCKRPQETPLGIMSEGVHFRWCSPLTATVTVAVTVQGHCRVITTTAWGLGLGLGPRLVQRDQSPSVNNMTNSRPSRVHVLSRAAQCPRFPTF